MLIMILLLSILLSYEKESGGRNGLQGYGKECTREERRGEEGRGEERSKRGRAGERVKADETVIIPFCHLLPPIIASTNTNMLRCANAHVQ